jgi:hypothetical protein
MCEQHLVSSYLTLQFVFQNRYHAEGMALKEILCYLALKDLPPCLDIIDSNPHVLDALIRQKGDEWFQFSFIFYGEDMDIFMSSKAIEQLIKFSNIVSVSTSVRLDSRM